MKYNKNCSLIIHIVSSTQDFFLKIQGKGRNVDNKHLVRSKNKDFTELKLLHCRNPNRSEQYSQEKAHLFIGFLNVPGLLLLNHCYWFNQTCCY